MVNPFGDRRGGYQSSVWTFNLDQNVIQYNDKEHEQASTLQLQRALELVEQRSLSLEDFETPRIDPSLMEKRQQTVSGPFWGPDLVVCPRAEAFLGRLLRDFGHAWRHIIRRDMNDTTFRHLAFATMWLATSDFTLHERTGWEHVNNTGAQTYANVDGLPQWEIPDVSTLRLGSTYFVLNQDIRKGMDWIRDENSKRNLRDVADSARPSVYVILTPWQIVLSRTNQGMIQYTKPVGLFDGISACDAGIDAILWATHTINTPDSPKTRNLFTRFPTEIQNRIITFAGISQVASANLALSLGIGSPFTWKEDKLLINLEDSKRNRTEDSPVETHILFRGVMSGLSYRREQHRQDTSVGCGKVTEPSYTEWLEQMHAKGMLLHVAVPSSA